MDLNNVKLMIGIPTHKEYCLYKFFTSFIQMRKPRYSQTYIYDDQPVSKSRNKIVKRAFDWGATHLMFLDDDMVIPENTVEILLNHDKDIVGLLAFKRKEPFTPVIYKKDERDPNRLNVIADYHKGLLPVEATGMACIIIKMDVFRNIGFPWYEFQEDKEYPGEMIGEDFTFCKKARDKGYHIYVDTMHPIGHIGMASVTEQVWNAHKSRIYGESGKIEFDRLGNLIPGTEKVFID